LNQVCKRFWKEFRIRNKEKEKKIEKWKKAAGQRSGPEAEAAHGPASQNPKGYAPSH
jgi:hypothetical protein